LSKKNVIKAGLIASNTGIDFIRPIFGCFFHEIRICQKRSCHGNHVGITPGQDFLSQFGGIDAIAGDQREANLSS